MKPKVAVVVLVVIVVVFIIAMSTNLFPKQKADKNNPPPDWVKAMQSKLVFHRALDIKDVSAPAGCISGNALVVPPLSACVYTIKSSTIPGRRVQMKTGQAHVTLYNGDKQLAENDAGPGDTIDVMTGGGKLVIVCFSATQCELDPTSAG